MADDERRSARTARKYAHVSNIIIKQEIRARMKQVNHILKKPAAERTEEELKILEQSPDIASAVQKRSKHRQLAKDRTQEVEDPPEVLAEKCQKLADAIQNSKGMILYTGAGISTAASIPDYRGPNGVWTLLQKGVAIKPQDLSDAEPTFTHMSITKLQQDGKVKHIVSQNCDGLHLRSGFPRNQLSEVHGNMYIERCTHCQPHREYIRLFDVTERTAVRRHHTGRMCHLCGEELRDTIIHFGEKAPFTSPYNWEEAAEAADEADVVLCLGSSLKVIKKYGCLWNLHKPTSKRPKLIIVNLQWTPKDDSATLKINGKCDEVMRQVMSLLNHEVPAYDREKDPIFGLAVELYPLEFKTTSKKILSIHQCLDTIETTMEVAVPKQETQFIASTAPDIYQHGQTDVLTPVDEEQLPVVKRVPDEQLRVINSIPQTLMSSSESEDSPSYSVGSPSVSVRELIRSRLQSKISAQKPAETYRLMGPLAQDNVSPERPSDKYKLIKYLLNKPTDNSADDKVQNLATHLRDVCDTISPGDHSFSPTAHSGLIYSNADSFRQLIPTSAQQITHTTEDTKEGQSVKTSYPTLVGALTSFSKQEPICSVVESQQGARQHTSGTNYQPLFGLGGHSSNADAISKLRSLMEGRPKMEPLQIDINHTDSSSSTKADRAGHAASAAGAATAMGSEEEGLLTVVPSSDEDAMLLAYRAVATHPGDSNSLGRQDSHLTLKRHFGSLEESPPCDDSADMEQTENISPSYTGSVPGWFGKGLVIKKRKKKVR